MNGSVLITGADGFIGANVTRRMLDAGCEVTALIHPESTAQRIAALLPRLNVIRGNLNDLDLIRPELERLKPHSCIHLAWYVEPGKYLDSPHNVEAVAASLRLIEALAAAGGAYFVGAGTCFEYDTTAGWLHEDGPTAPQTLYAAAKLSLCLMGSRLAALHGMGFGWGRVFYLYGPEEDERRAVPALFKALLAEEPFPATAGEQVRDYLHVEDVAAGFCTLAMQQAEGIYNIGSGTPLTMRQLMQTAGEIVGRAELIQFGAYPYRPHDPPFVCADAQKLRALGWSPRYTLQSGLQQTADHLMSAQG